MDLIDRGDPFIGCTGDPEEGRILSCRRRRSLSCRSSNAGQGITASLWKGIFFKIYTRNRFSHRSKKNSAAKRTSRTAQEKCLETCCRISRVVAAQTVMRKRTLVSSDNVECIVFFRTVWRALGAWYAKKKHSTRLVWCSSGDIELYDIRYLYFIFRVDTIAEQCCVGAMLGVSRRRRLVARVFVTCTQQSRYGTGSIGNRELLFVVL